jgi:hypothetical protein
MKMFCQKCGYEMPDDAVICNGCGRTVQPIQQPIKKESKYRPVKSVRRANKSFIIACLIFGGVFFPFFLLPGWLRGAKTIHEIPAVIYFLGLIGLAGMLFGFWQAYRYIHRMWSMIQDEDARTTPGIAVGFLFIPFFNWYWAFQAYRGWAVDYNRFIQKNVLEAPRMPEGLFLTFAIIRILLRIPGLNIFIYPAWIVLLIIMFAYICNAINFFAKLEPQLPSKSKIENTSLQASEIQSI